MNINTLKKKNASPETIKQAKKEIVSNINKAGMLYHSLLEGRDVLVIADKKTFRFNADKGNFLHLCGINTYLNPWHFYQISAKGKLDQKRLNFRGNHGLASAYEKTQSLVALLTAIQNGSGNIFVLENIKTDSRNYPFGIHLEDIPFCTMCIGKTDDNGHVPISTRSKKKDNINCEKEHEINYILTRRKNSKYYDTLFFGDIKDLKSLVAENLGLKELIDINHIEGHIKKDRKKTMTIKSKHANVKENNINIGEVVNLVTKKHNSSLERLGMELPEQKFEKDDIIFIHDTMIREYGGLYGVRDEGLLDASVSNPYQSVFGEDLYPSVYDKAAKYLFDFAHYQIFNDGNKRTGLATMEAYLIANGYDFTMDAKTQYQFVMDIANNKYVEIPDIAKIIEENTIFLPKKDINFFNDDIIYNDNKDITGNEDQNYERE